MMTRSFVRSFRGQKPQVEPDENLALPRDVKGAGFEYVLEVHVAKEVMEVFQGKPPSLAEQVRLLLHYAEHDAYPDWVYSRQE